MITQTNINSFPCCSNSVKCSIKCSFINLAFLIRICCCLSTWTGPNPFTVHIVALTLFVKKLFTSILKTWIDDPKWFPGFISVLISKVLFIADNALSNYHLTSLIPSVVYCQFYQTCMHKVRVSRLLSYLTLGALCVYVASHAQESWMQ